MERTRRAGFAALFVVLSVGAAAAVASTDHTPQQLGAVAWPASTLLVSEVQTGGGASASDEFAEITNVGAEAVDLAGLEIAYATSTGGTVTRKASWSASQLLAPGQHLLIANAAGAYAGLADATYSGGFAATGGAVVLRAIGGEPIDAVGWGDATNDFVEGAPAAAPAAGSSVERLPGGLDGNTTDTNANSTDWFVQEAPNPQSLAAPPAPAPTASPSPQPSPTLDASQTPAASPTTAPSAPPSATPTTTVEPSAIPSAIPTPTVEPSSTPGATLTPTAAPTATPTETPAATTAPTPTPAPTASPTGSPTAEPTPTATPLPVMSILDARAQANGTSVRVIGVLTTHLGALEAGRKAFVQDDTAGIALYLDVAVSGGLPADTLISAVGTLDDRFAERTLRVNLADVVSLGEQQRPQAWLQQTGAILEWVEGYRVLVQGVTVGAPTELADGLGLMVDDGTGAVRVIVAPAALGSGSVPSGTTVVAVGPVGQRDSTGTGLAGYRIHATEESDFGIVVTPPPTPTPGPTATPGPSPTSSSTPTPPTPSSTPAPTATASPAPTAAPAPTRTPAPSPGPTATPNPTPGPTPPPVISVVEARGASIGAVVTVAGVVTAEGGRLGLPPLVAIADGTGGIAVRVPDGMAPPGRGTTVQVKGPLADPYGQLELRPTTTGFKVTGQGSLPAPIRLLGADLGEATEGRLAELTGTVSATPKKSTSGDLTIDVVDAGGSTFRVISDGSSGIQASDLAKGRTYRLTGVVGQRASRKGALDGYRVYLRDRADIVPVATSSGGPAPSGAPASVTPIATALAMPEGTAVTIEGTVTAGVTLLDSSGRRIVIQDATGAIEVLLPSGSSGPAVGARLRTTGTTGRAWGAPRVAAATVQSVSGNGSITPAVLDRPAAERDEWLLVRLSGSVAKVERLGDRWRAEIVLAGGANAPVHGQAGAGIPSTAIVVGRRITVAGIVKRPYPTASDRRFAVLPRTGADVSIGPAGSDAPSGSVESATHGPTSSAHGNPAIDVTPDTDLAALGDYVGQRVRVGGLIARLADDGFDLDDGTALARIELRGEMAELLPYLRNGEAVAATGTVELIDGSAVVVVDDEGTLLRVGSLGQALPIGPQGAEADAPSSSHGGAAELSAGAGAFGSELAPTSLLAMAVLTLLSVLVTVLRRRLLRRSLRIALVERLASLRPKAGGG